MSHTWFIEISILIFYRFSPFPVTYKERTDKSALRYRTPTSQKVTALPYPKSDRTPHIPKKRSHLPTSPTAIPTERFAIALLHIPTSDHTSIISKT
ncbi:MAG: hypothetical protein ACKO3K_12095 [Cuspidothrix sp.]